MDDDIMEQAAQHFASGVNAPGEVRGLAASGRNVGITVGEIRTGLLEALEDVSGGMQRVFVDSGAFGEVAFVDGAFVVVNEITESMWDERFEVYRWAACSYGVRAYIVAPDRVGDQAVTLERLARYAADVQVCASARANVIVPVQKGALPMSEMFRRACEILALPNLIAGVPMKKDATSLADLAELVASLPVDGARVHLLGLGPESKRFQKVIDLIRSIRPSCSITSDSVTIRRLVGRTNGRGGGPRELTAAQDRARAMGMTDPAEVKATGLAIQGLAELDREKAAARARGWRDEGDDDYVPRAYTAEEIEAQRELDAEADRAIAARAPAPTCDAPVMHTQLDLDIGTTPARTPVVLSLGGGLDSFAMLVEGLERGERIDVVAFVDVGDAADPEAIGEWPGTYRHVEEVVRPLCARRGIEFVEISARTGYMVRDARSLFGWLEARNQIPVSGPTRICTRIAKVERFERWLADRWPGQAVEVWIGFEAGEEGRAGNDPNAGKSAQRRNRFPLIEWGMCRCRCEARVRELGYPIPRKSACKFCPYGKRDDWQRFEASDPRGYGRVVDLEARKPLTKNGLKLSIMGYDSRKKRGTPLPVYVARPYKRRPMPCKVCGAAERATKAAGCDYLEDPEPAAVAA